VTVTDALVLILCLGSVVATAGAVAAQTGAAGDGAAAVCGPPWLVAVALVLLAGAGGVSAIERIQQRRERAP